MGSQTFLSDPLATGIAFRERPIVRNRRNGNGRYEYHVLGGGSDEREREQWKHADSGLEPHVRSSGRPPSSNESNQLPGPGIVEGQRVGELTPSQAASSFTKPSSTRPALE